MGMDPILVVALVALLVAVVAFAHARKTARKLAILEEQYWQLKFDHGELKAKLDPSSPEPPPARQTFVPLTSLRRTPDSPAAPGDP